MNEVIQVRKQQIASKSTHKTHFCVPPFLRLFFCRKAVQSKIPAVCAWYDLTLCVLLTFAVLENETERQFNIRDRQALQEQIERMFTHSRATFAYPWSSSGRIISM
jgi:hypothetical protein